jgi:hypothetical protein
MINIAEFGVVEDVNEHRLLGALLMVMSCMLVKRGGYRVSNSKLHVHITACHTLGRVLWGMFLVLGLMNSEYSRHAQIRRHWCHWRR